MTTEKTLTDEFEKVRPQLKSFVLRMTASMATKLQAMSQHILQHRIQLAKKRYLQKENILPPPSKKGMEVLLETQSSEEIILAFRVH
jgi:hypothetical protein